MAKATVTLPTEVMERFSRLGTETDRIIDSCLEAGGDVALGFVRDGLEGVVGKDTKFPSRSTGELQQALGVSPPKLNRRGMRDVKVGFHEPRSDGRPNALIAKHMAEWRKWEDGGVVIVTGLENIGDIDGRKELDDARKLGREI